MRSLDGDAAVNGRARPTLVLVGTSGSGKTCVAQEIAKTCGLRVQEDQELLESAYSRSFDELVLDEHFPLQEALESAGIQLLSDGCDIAVLSPSQVNSSRILSKLSQLIDEGTSVVLLRTSIDEAARRVGLNAPRSVGLGTPRALFAAMSRQLDSTYQDLATFSCDTGENTAREVADTIIAACKIATV
ncbi:MAG: shikimate kinase [Actinomyces sp.]|nr:shikimate kinase [Actinomyces sp.]MBF0962591.1 shikimate kinase [Actinomyces sp.]